MMARSFILGAHGLVTSLFRLPFLLRWRHIRTAMDLFVGTCALLTSMSSADILTALAHWSLGRGCVWGAFAVFRSTCAVGSSL